MDTFFVILQIKNLTWGNLLEAMQLVNEGWLKHSDFSQSDSKSHVCTGPLRDLPATLNLSAAFQKAELISSLPKAYYFLALPTVTAMQPFLHSTPWLFLRADRRDSLKPVIMIPTEINWLNTIKIKTFILARGYRERCLLWKRVPGFKFWLYPYQ